MRGVSGLSESEPLLSKEEELIDAAAAEENK
jgi:hypothetical protein